MKTCLLSPATNGDAALRTLCPLIGLPVSVFMLRPVSFTCNPPTLPKRQTGQSQHKAQGLGRDEGTAGMERVRDAAQEERKENQKLEWYEKELALLLIKH